LWNLVFMQFDRSADGSMTPLPAPSIDTGAGLERLASVLQGVDSNYRTDLFVPLLEEAASAAGVPYDAESPRSVSHRVLADHARAVAFLLADGVLPSNDGQGYVLRRILRRAVRHAWLLGRREPTLVRVVDRVIEVMGGAYPDLPGQRSHLLQATKAEEERFLATIDAGMSRIDELAPVLPAAVRVAIAEGREAAPVIDGDDAFRLHDTFGYPLDLTELIARERGYRVDVAGYEAALDEQRERSRADRKATVSDTLVFSDAIAVSIDRAQTKRAQRKIWTRRKLRSRTPSSRILKSSPSSRRVWAAARPSSRRTGCPSGIASSLSG